MVVVGGGGGEYLWPGSPGGLGDSSRTSGQLPEGTCSAKLVSRGKKKKKRLSPFEHLCFRSSLTLLPCPARFCPGSI